MIVLVGLIIVVTALLDLALAIPSGTSVTRAPATSTIDSPVGVVTKLDAALVAVSILTFHQMNGVLRGLFKVEPVLGDIVLGCVRDRTGNSRCHDGQNGEKAGDLHDAAGNGL